MTPLFGFLNRQLAVPFVWGGFGGGSDCCLILADWFWHLRGFDPAEGLRFAYDSPASCHRVTGWFRDPVAVVAGIAEGRAGRPRVLTPGRGDIALVRLADSGTHVGAIFTGTAWAMKAEGRGLHTRDAATVTLMAAWGMDYADG